MLRASCLCGAVALALPSSLVILGCAGFDPHVVTPMEGKALQEKAIHETIDNQRIYDAQVASGHRKGPPALPAECEPLETDDLPTCRSWALARLAAAQAQQDEAAQQSENFIINYQAVQGAQNAAQAAHH